MRFVKCIEYDLFMHFCLLKYELSVLYIISYFFGNISACDWKNTTSLYVNKAGLNSLQQFLMSGWANGYSYQCDLVDYSSSPQALRVRNILIISFVCILMEFSNRFLIFLDGLDLLAVLLLKIHRDAGYCKCKVLFACTCYVTVL